MPLRILARAFVLLLLCSSEVAHVAARNDRTIRGSVVGTRDGSNEVVLVRVRVMCLTVDGKPHEDVSFPTTDLKGDFSVNVPRAYQTFKLAFVDTAGIYWPKEMQLSPNVNPMALGKIALKPQTAALSAIERTEVQRIQHALETSDPQTGRVLLARFIKLAPNSNGSSWVLASADQASQHYSELAEINASNVANLRLAWTFSAGLLSGNEGSPLVVADTMYIRPLASSDVYAINLKDQTVRWKYLPVAPKGTATRSDTRGAGLAYGDGKVLLQQLDASLVALNAATGAVAWSASEPTPADPGLILSTPRVFKDKVLIGRKEAGPIARNRVLAYQITNGKRAWAASSEGSDVGAWYSYDPALNLVYYSNAPRDSSGTIFARDLDSGIEKWVYQSPPTQPWHFYGVSNVPLVDVNVDGRSTPALVHYDRSGFVYTVDRVSGELVNSQRYTSYAAANPVQDACKDAAGSIEQQPTSYDRKYGLTVVYENGMCMQYEPFLVEYTAGQPYVGATLTMFPARDRRSDTRSFIARDPTSGKVVWSKPDTEAGLGGTLSTAGDVVFYGTLEGSIKAVSTVDGKELWKFKLPSAVTGNVFTFEYDGRQYVGALSGIGGWAGIGPPAAVTNGTAGLGAVGGYKDLAKYTTLGSTLFVFALPSP